MTFWIRNISGGVASLPFNGCYQVADQGAVDLEADLDGQPANRAILDSTALATAVLVDGTWALLADDGVTQLSTSVSQLKLRSAGGLEARTADGLITRNEWATITPNPADNAWFDIIELAVPDGKALAVSLNVHTRAGTDASLEVGAAPFVFTSRRRTGESVVTPSAPRLDQSEGGIRFRVDDRAATVAIQGRRRGAGAVRTCINGTTEVES